MSLEEFKDWLFEVLNERDKDILSDIETDDRASTFRIRMIGGAEFEVECRKVE